MKFFNMPFAEHNIACDPHAAKKVFDKARKILIADWGLTIRYGIPVPEYDSLCKCARSFAGRFYS